MTITNPRCHSCGRLRTIRQLDAKPERGEDPATCDWTRLECERCYGLGYDLGPEEDGSIARPASPIYYWFRGLTVLARWIRIPARCNA